MIQKTTMKIPIAKNVGTRKMAVPRPAKGMLAKIAPNLLDLVADLVERMTTQTRRTPREGEPAEEVVGLLAVRSSFRGLAFFL